MSLSLLFPFAVKRSRACTPVVVPLGSLLVPARARGGRGLLTATARDVGALGLTVTVLDPWIDTGHTVTACGVTGGGLLTAPGRVTSVHVFSLPAGEIGVTASGRTLSRIARVTARCHEGDSEEPGRLARRESQEGVGAVASQPPVILKRRRLSLLLQEGRFSPRFRLLCRVLPGVF